MNRSNYRITFTAKILIIKLLICSAGLLSGFTWRTYIDNQKWDNLMIPNVEVAGIDIGGKTLEESISLIEKSVIIPTLNGETRISANDKIYTLDNSRLISDNNLESVINNAFNYGKALSSIEKKLLFNREEKDIMKFDIVFGLNESYINETIKNISSDINREPKNASIFFNDDGTRILNTDKKGLKLNEAKLAEDIKRAFSNKNDQILLIEAQVEEIIPEITNNMLSNLNTKIASFNTSFNTSLVGRSNNINLAAKLINSKIVNPGEIFSFNGTVGERTKERGFMEAPVIMGNSFDIGVGGGICQLSSTLYNAVLRTGINSIERIHHTLPSDYVPLGLDATVDWNNIDYRFKNTLEYPIYIQTLVNNNILQINIYSDAKLANKEFTVNNDIYEVVDTNTEFITNPNLEEGQSIVTKKGNPGYKVRVIRNTVENGIITNTEIISDDYYYPVSQVVSIGMKVEK